MAFDGPFNLDRYIKWAHSPHGATFPDANRSRELINQRARQAKRSMPKMWLCVCGFRCKTGPSVRTHKRSCPEWTKHS